MLRFHHLWNDFENTVNISFNFFSRIMVFLIQINSSNRSVYKSIGVKSSKSQFLFEIFYFFSDELSEISFILFSDTFSSTI